jgi:hypothetical protein
MYCALRSRDRSARFHPDHRDEGAHRTGCGRSILRDGGLSMVRPPSKVTCRRNPHAPPAPSSAHLTSLAHLTSVHQRTVPMCRGDVADMEIRWRSRNGLHLFWRTSPCCTDRKRRLVLDTGTPLDRLLRTLRICSDVSRTLGCRGDRVEDTSGPTLRPARSGSAFRRTPR